MKLHYVKDYINAKPCIYTAMFIKTRFIKDSKKDCTAGTTTYHKKDTKTRIQAVKAEKHETF